MSQTRTNGIDRLHPRRWLFANCVFDESNWSLSVAGRRVPVEIKPLALLRALLLQAGKVVPKHDLLDAVWPDVEVVEASLTTAVRKLRLALGDERRKTPIIETAPRIGYRLAVPVEVEDLTGAPNGSIAEASSAQGQGPTAVSERPGKARLKWIAGVGGLAVAAAAAILALSPSFHVLMARAAGSFSQRDAANALRKLDVATIEEMIAAGWDPDTPFDDQGNGALNMLLNVCEWDPGHDRRKMLLMARTLIDGGAQLDRQNVWGDTAYSIAKAKRYCGPDHPVTKSIRTMCYAGFKPLGDRCLASYELARLPKASGSKAARR